MRRHALQAALTLYENGTYTLEPAASQAGVAEPRRRTCLARRGIEVEESGVSPPGPAASRRGLSSGTS